MSEELALVAAARWLEVEPARLRPLPGDVSPRRYARVVLDDESTWIVSIYPSELRDTCRRFLATTELLTTAGIRCPRVERADPDLGFVLLEDGGPTTLYETMQGQSPRRVDRALRSALPMIAELQSLDSATVGRLNPSLGGARLRRELDQTLELFLVPRELVGGAGTAQRLEAAFDALCGELERPGLVPCHRDFMARNLISSSRELTVIDHQDLCLGPAQYDLASLFNDSLFASPELEREVLGEMDESRRLAYRRAVVQRTLKAIGTYCKFAALGSDRYLRLVPVNLGRSWRHWTAVPELEPLVAELGPRWRPALEAVW